jgi:hypothetical protein
MDKLIYVFVYFVSKVRSLVGLVIPIFADAADFRSWPTWVKVLVHCIILGLILWGLWWLNRQQVVQDLLLVKATTTIQQIYLPLIFILLYLLSWLGYFWWQLLNRGDVPEFEDIAIAWREGVRKLDKAGIDLRDSPLYLVVGRPVSGDDGLFLASQAKIEVRAPSIPDSPIRFFAGRDAIYITCSGASTWGRFADALASPESFVAEGPSGTTIAGQTIDPSRVLGFVDEAAREEFNYLLRLQSERPLTPDEQLRLRELGDLINQESKAIIRRVSLLPEESAAGPKRLAYLCELIKQDRQPYCPINGVLVLIPWAALDSDEVTREAIPLLAADLAVARRTLRLRYPHMLMVCDLEEAHGFEEFRRGFPKDMLKQRIGQRLPLVPDRPPAEVPAVMAQAADWISQCVISSWVLKFLRLEWPPELRKTPDFVPSYNRRLFQFLLGIYNRVPRLGRLMARGLPSGIDTRQQSEPADALPLCGGCYLAATGRDEKQQAFVAGVFQRLNESQSAVSWSNTAISEDRVYRNWANITIIIVVLILLMSGFGFYQMWRVSQNERSGRQQSALLEHSASARNLSAG